VEDGAAEGSVLHPRSGGKTPLLLDHGFSSRRLEVWMSGRLSSRRRSSHSHRPVKRSFRKALCSLYGSYNLRMARRLRGDEETLVLDADAGVERARAGLERAETHRNRLIVDLVEAGARVSDIADVLGVTRTTIHAWMDRVRE